MNAVKYSILAVINGQEFSSKNNTYEDFKKLVDMIYAAGGWIVEYVEEIR